MKQKHLHNNQPSLTYDAKKTKTAYQRLRVLSHTLRVEMINYMAKRENLVATKEIAEHFHINPSEAQQHLDLLSKANYLTSDNSLSEVRYSTNKNRINRIARLIKGIVN